MDSEHLTLLQSLVDTTYQLVARKRLKAARTTRFLTEGIPTGQDHRERLDEEIRLLEAERDLLRAEIVRQQATNPDEYENTLTKLLDALVTTKRDNVLKEVLG